MIDILRRRVQEAEFQIGSLFEADVPSCEVVTLLGECLNYLFHAENDLRALVRLFRRVYDALAPGAVFVFDFAEPGQVARGTTIMGFSEGEDWVVLLEKRRIERGER